MPCSFVFQRELLCYLFVTFQARQINNECCEFLPWLQQKAGTEVSSVLSVGNSAFGRSLYASTAIHAGDCMLKVPYSVHLTSDKFPLEISPFIDYGVGSVSCVAVVLMAEQKLGMESRWAAYITSLPQMDEMHNTFYITLQIFWSEDDLQMISQSPVYKETIEHKANIEKEFFALKPALECFPQIFGDIRLENFMHACALVSSRAWKTSKGVSLIPFADFLNHDGTSDSLLLSDDYKEISEVLADRDYDVGEPVMIRYGKFSNATLLLDFGFTVPNNIYDQVQLWMDVPSHDPLYAAKIELLNKHRFPRGTKSDGFNDARGPFIIKEVKSAEGKGKGIPQALRAFARVLSATSVKDLEEMALEAAENDGRLARRPLKNREREVHAHRTLLFRVERMVRDHDAAIKVLQSSVVSVDDTTLFVRRGMARDLLNGELHVLRSAHTWLANYCAALC
ncbi:fructose-bisphosphate aldolase-lysine N-methyltransferase, chloroplastic-like isoform X1 [Ananas comosus]|uniref:Fructose-bisphosphate aldolase-lysine N-methyltransferase, chloroplastic-like isoform X1 n=1 Tax=Ananas comosus TaxID=4615 RepID=A0A6P5EV52_ANACO|nr:fructose-bisphosphate aldolase-lysine N-methyltransferase, chloroplastic-like isoform X1 [Ananas comosus]